MIQRDILVLRKKVRCMTCGEEFDGVTEAPDEGFGYAAQLYECSECHTLLSHPLEAGYYLGSVLNRVQGVSCPGCSRPLADTLRKIDFAGRCPNCGRRDYCGTDEAVEARILSYQIYE